MKSFSRNQKIRERGVTSIEYGLLAAFIAVTALIGFSALGGANSGNWDEWVDKVMTAIRGG